MTDTENCDELVVDIVLLRVPRNSIVYSPRVTKLEGLLIVIDCSLDDKVIKAGNYSLIEMFSESTLNAVIVSPKVQEP